MARTPSQAVAGYYPLQPHLVLAIAGLVQADRGASAAFVDPCAGDGAAVLDLLDAVVGLSPHRPGHRASERLLYAAEMEAGRAAALSQAVSRRLSSFHAREHAVHSDAFRVHWELGNRDGATLLYLNPPYDQDAELGRTEERFLRRFTEALADRGILVLVAPGHALRASADTLAAQYDVLGCFRFPDPEWEDFRQVVLVAARALGRVAPDPAIAERARAWAAAPQDLPPLPGAGAAPIAALPSLERPGIQTWEAVPLDVRGMLAEYQPWERTDRAGRRAPIRGMAPENPVTRMFARTYPLAMPPRPAHIAAGAASGIFDGITVAPDDPASGLPSLLVKGTFTKDYQTIEERQNAEGATIGLVQAQQPKMVVTVLDLRAGAYHELASSPEQTGAATPADMTTGDLISRYGHALMRVLAERCPALHDPANPAHELALPSVPRRLYRAQAHATMATVKLLRQQQPALILGEIGCLRGDTPIRDPLDGTTLTVAERHRRGVGFHVWSLGPHGPVVAAALPPVKYRPAQMVRVVLAHSNSVVVTPAHRFWDGRDWVRASDVALRLRESAPVLLPSSSDTDLRVHAQGGTRWTGTPPGSPAGCPRGPRSCGAPPQPVSGGDPAPAPSPGGAPARSRPSSRGGGLASRSAHSRVCPTAARHATPDSAPLAEGQRHEQYHPPHESHPTPETGSTPSPRRSAPGSDPAHRERGLALSVLPSTAALVTASNSPVGDNHNFTQPAAAAQVLSVEPLDVEPYYDFHVPVFNNYWACGLWHHNSGKSTIALVAAEALLARRILVVCPPHLLDSWREQVAAVLPWAHVAVLQSISDVEAVRLDDEHECIVALLSRERAKLGSTVVGVGPRCPRCGHRADASPAERARQRLRCAAKSARPTNGPARLVRRLAIQMAAEWSSERVALAVLHTFGLGGRLRPTEPNAPRRRLTLASPQMAKVVWRAALLAIETGAGDDACAKALLHLLAAVNDEALTARVAERLFRAALLASDAYAGGPVRKLAQTALLLHAGLPSAERSADLPRALTPRDQRDEWANWSDKRRYLAGGGECPAWAHAILTRLTSGQVGLAGTPVGDPAHATEALRKLAAASVVEASAPCGEPLYSATAEPRRYPLATYIARRRPKLFDFLVIDECFVAGTLVSGRPIETYHEGDLVEAYDEQTGQVSQRRVRRRFISRPSALVRITFSNGRSFACTPGHPILTSMGWLPAGLLVSGHLVVCTRCDTAEEAMDRPLRVVHDAAGAGGRGAPPGQPRAPEGVRVLRADVHVSGEARQEQANDTGQGSRPSSEARSSMGGAVSRLRRACRAGGSASSSSSPAWPRILRAQLWEGLPAAVLHDGALGLAAEQRRPRRGQHLGAHARTQSNGAARGSRASEGDAARDGLEAPRARRERRGPHGTADALGLRPGLADGGDRPHRGIGGRLPQPLQVGHRGADANDSDRGGRRVALRPRTSRARQEEGRVPAWARVDRVEVLEPGRDGTFGGVCPDGLVYNLEVEGLHTYLAEGVVVHNCHDSNNLGSAQERAAHRLTGLGMPTVALTGSVMNGYAESLFANLWALSAAFRAEFPRGAQGAFVDRYGYRKHVVEYRDAEGRVVEFGSMSDARKQERDAGQAPGVLPVLLLRHLLPISATIHKADLALDLPPCRELAEEVQPTPELRRRHDYLAQALLRQVKADQFTPLAGKLFGQLAELPSHLDRASADVGNEQPGGRYVVRYPESAGGAVVATAEPFPAAQVLPKERWLLDVVARELAEGRRAMVFGWHVELLPRLQRLLQAATGEVVPILRPDRVPTAKRQAWIDREVVAKGRRLMVVNPVAIQTGLNNLVHFSTIVWMQNPACNPIVYRQATGRIDRIGQTLETRVYFPIYAVATQRALHRLLMHKVGVSMSTDGLDAEGALRAAGVGDSDVVTGMSVGRQLYRMLVEGAAALPLSRTGT